jgi:hypothetical protein
MKDICDIPVYLCKFANPDQIKIKNKGGYMLKQFFMCFCVMLVLLMFFVSPTSLFSKVTVGEEVLQQFETTHPYDAAKGVVWEQEFHWTDAGYIAIHFSNFDLAPGDYVEISSPDGKFAYKFKEKGKRVKHNTESINSFWATHIPGATAIVRLHSKNKNSAYGFVIDKWARGYESGYIEAVLAGLEEDELSRIEAICSSDDKQWAKCYSSTTMYDKARTVARLLIGGTSACTGWLLGSEGHVVTNNHCISTQSEANNTDYEFMAEGATCATNCASWGACPGTVEASSGTLIKTNSSLDYTLILLPTNVTSTYGYLQLRDELPTIGERIYIPQHPQAYGKQMAVESDVDGGYAEVYSLNQTPCTGGPGDIGYYADTEGGSSGSPVIAYSDHLVVALHHCANCPNRGVPIPSIISDLGSSLPDDAIGGEPDTTPPVISNVQATNITHNSVTITWTTDEISDSVVYYGLTTSYGNTESDSTDVTSHSIGLTGLSPNTTYHYKVESTDPSDNTAQSGDYMFTTDEEPVNPEMYVFDISMQKNNWWFISRASATITIKDTDGGFVSNATVYTSWSGKWSGTLNGTTNSSGQVTLTTPWCWGSGTFTVTVTDVTHASLTYNPSLNVETSDSI